MTKEMPEKTMGFPYVSYYLTSRWFWVQHGFEDQMSELARRQNVSRKLFDAAEGHVEARGDNAAFVDAANEFHNDLVESQLYQRGPNYEPFINWLASLVWDDLLGIFCL